MSGGLTVLGGSGYVGSSIRARLTAAGVDHHVPGRHDDLDGADLGTVIDCAGLTADFRTRPLETVEAHVCRVLRLLRECRVDTYVYLSSARVYQDPRRLAGESDRLVVDPAELGSLYDLSKAMGEALVHAAPGVRARVARLAHVYPDRPGSPNFLASVVSDAVNDGKVELRTSLDSSKDYVHVDDVCDALLAMAGVTGGGASHDVYNVASGRNITHRQLAARLEEVAGCSVTVADGSPTVAYPPIDVARLRTDLGVEPRSVLDDLPEVVAAYREALAGR